MIARILYRNNVQGVLKYVLGKADSTVLGFQNTYCDTDTNRSFSVGSLTIGDQGCCHVVYRYEPISMGREAYLFGFRPYRENNYSFWYSKPHLHLHN
ncbi:MAG: hypothetical protein QM485_02475 [Flavobacteriaceae bacterium]